MTKKGGAAKGEKVAITINKPKRTTMKVNVFPISPLIMKKLPSGYIKELEAKVSGLPIEKKKVRDLDQEFKDSIHYYNNGKKVGFPAIGFKKSMINACRFIEDITMAEARGLFNIEGVIGDDGDVLVPIEGKPQRNDRCIPPGGKVSTPVYTVGAMFPEWSATLQITFDPSLISKENLINLLSVAGDKIGIGWGRPYGKSGGSGPYGRFSVVN